MLRRFLITMTTFLVVISGALCSGKSVSAGEQREQETFVRFMSLPMEPP